MMTMCDYSFEIDLWGLGITMYTLLVGRMPFKENTVNKSVKKVMNCEVNFPRYERIPISRKARELLKWIFNADPLKRPTLEQVESHKFFTSSKIPIILPITSYSVLPTPELHGPIYTPLPAEEPEEKNEDN